MIDRERTVREFMDLVRIDSLSRREGRLRDFLTGCLKNLEFEVYEDSAGSAIGGDSGNIIARLPGTIPDRAVFFCAHMDTVEPGSGVEPVLDGEVIRSAGDTILGADDKAGIAAVLEAVRSLKEDGDSYPTVELLFTVAEEQGLMGSKYLERERITAPFGYVLDSVGPAGTIVVQGPTQNEIQFRVVGKSAHAGINPEDGINAIYLAACAISSLRIGRIDEETTCNLGIISGGKARNIVPDEVIVKGEARSLNPEKLERLTADMVDTFKKRVEEKGGKCESQVTLLYPELSLSEDAPVVRVAVEAAHALGIEPQLVKTGGGSDANILNGLGLPCANLGIGMEAVHTPDEYIRIKSLVDNARYVLQIIKTVGDMTGD